MSSSFAVRALDGSCADRLRKKERSHSPSYRSAEAPTPGAQPEHQCRSSCDTVHGVRGRTLGTFWADTGCISSLYTLQGKRERRIPRVGIQTVFSFPLSSLQLGPSLQEQNKTRTHSYKKREASCTWACTGMFSCTQLRHLPAVLNSSKHGALSL